MQKEVYNSRKNEIENFYLKWFAIFEIFYIIVDTKKLFFRSI